MYNSDPHKGRRITRNPTSTVSGGSTQCSCPNELDMAGGSPVSPVLNELAVSPSCQQAPCLLKQSVFLRVKSRPSSRLLGPSTPCLIPVKYYFPKSEFPPACAGDLNSFIAEFTWVLTVAEFCSCMEVL